MNSTAHKLKRLFFALQPDASCQQQILDYQQQCQALLPLAKATTANNLHLTLHFIGQADEAYAESLQQAAARVVAPEVKFMLDRHGYFKKPKIFWLGCKQPDKSLLQLHQQLGLALQNCGFTEQYASYVPHVSLFRKFNTGYQAIQMPAVNAISFTANRFVLMESISTAHGVQYRPIQSYTLG